MTTFFDGIRAGLDEQLGRLALRRCRWVGHGVRVTGRVSIRGGGEVWIGDGVFLDAATAPIELYAWDDAVIVVADHCRLRGGTSLEATRAIRLGKRAHVGGFCRIMDNHFHPLLGDRNRRPPPRPVTIGDDVVLGPRTIVLAGAEVPNGAHHPAGSIVNARRRCP